MNSHCPACGGNSTAPPVINYVEELRPDPRMGGAPSWQRFPVHCQNSWHRALADEFRRREDDQNDQILKSALTELDDVGDLDTLRLHLDRIMPAMAGKPVRPLREKIMLAWQRAATAGADEAPFRAFTIMIEVRGPEGARQRWDLVDVAAGAPVWWYSEGESYRRRVVFLTAEADAFESKGDSFLSLHWAAQPKEVFSARRVVARLAVPAGTTPPSLGRYRKPRGNDDPLQLRDSGTLILTPIVGDIHRYSSGVHAVHEALQFRRREP